MPSRQDWDALQARLPGATARRAAEARHADRARIVAERMESLEGADEWTTYCAHLDVLLERDEAERESLRDAMDIPDVVGEELQRLRLRLQRVVGRLEARSQDRALPATLRAQAEKVLTAEHAGAQ